MTINTINNHSLLIKQAFGQNQTQSQSPSYIEQLIQRVEKLVNKPGQGNFQDNRSLNFILLAKKALKNGNITAAQGYIQKALSLIDTEKNISLHNPDEKPEKKQEPEPTTPPPKKNLPKEKEDEENKHVYQDVSTGENVTFKYGSQLTGPQSFLAVPAHEQQHVRHALSQAMLTGKKVNVYVSYRIKYDPKTGEPYIAGGQTKVITHKDHKHK